LIGHRRDVGWDSWRGIPVDQQDLIFQEFYQIGNPERDRTRGLGLGLAIVRRLTHILRIPMRVQSRVGKGSVFKLSVALAPNGQAATEPAPEVSLAVHRSLFILVVDDDMAIQDAMMALLVGWGHQVVATGSCAEMLERAAAFTAAPDLIISDIACETVRTAFSPSNSCVRSSMGIFPRS